MKISADRLGWTDQVVQLKVEGSANTFKVENVSWKQISIIDLNHYHILFTRINLRNLCENTPGSV
jgi:hypothetical protein